MERSSIHRRGSPGAYSIAAAACVAQDAHLRLTSGSLRRNGGQQRLHTGCCAAAESAASGLTRDDLAGPQLHIHQPLDRPQLPDIGGVRRCRRPRASEIRSGAPTCGGCPWRARFRPRQTGVDEEPLGSWTIWGILTRAAEHCGEAPFHDVIIVPRAGTAR
jgi:hypothetical protein